MFSLSFSSFVCQLGGEEESTSGSAQGPSVVPGCVGFVWFGGMWRGLRATPGSALGLILVLCSGIIPSGSQETIDSVRDQATSSKGLIHSTIFVAVRSRV